MVVGCKLSSRGPSVGGTSVSPLQGPRTPLPSVESSETLNLPRELRRLP